MFILDYPFTITVHEFIFINVFQRNILEADNN